MIDTQADELVTRLNYDMRRAMKNKQRIRLDELRSLLARISNAEAVPAEANKGKTEVPRKVLTFDDIQTIITDEIHELTDALAQIDSASFYAGELQEKITALEKYLKQPNY